MNVSIFVAIEATPFSTNVRKRLRRVWSKIAPCERALTQPAR